MGIQIEDGTGSGRSSKVNLENRLATTSVSTTIEHHQTHKWGRSYNLIFQQTPTQINPSEDTSTICFLYIENLSDMDMVIEGISLRIGGDNDPEIIKILGEDKGTPIGGSSVTPSNLNLGSGNIASGTFLTGNTITGLSGGIELDRIYIGSSNTSTYFNFEQDIIVPKNHTITLYAVNTGIEIDGTINFNYHDSLD